MKTKVDIIIVGSGIAGCSLAWQWILKGKTVMMISHGNNASSSVAAGVYNPLVLKRFTSVWKASEQLKVLNDTYTKIEPLIKTKVLHPLEILRRLHDPREVKSWIKKSIRADLKEYMNKNIIKYENDAIDAPFDYGRVSGSGWLDTVLFMKETIQYLKNMNSFHEESFHYNELHHLHNSVSYKEFQAEKIIFAEGYNMINNPFFNDLPLQGNKGEVMTIKVPGLQLDYIIKSSVFLMPYTADLFWVGATYNTEDLSSKSTDAGKEFLTSRLERFLNLPYTVIDYKYGIRPTTMDRRPFVGAHNTYKHYYIFNGMGSRAVLLAPWAALQLYHNIYDNEAIDLEMDINRFL